MAAKLDDKKSCPICFEHYTTQGDKVPILLPCDHTLCRMCTTKLSKNGRIVCPECRKEHVGPANQGFQEHSLLIEHLKKEDAGAQKCAKHGRETEFYCNEKDCKIPICAVCLVEDHIGHDVDERHEQRQGAEQQKEIEVLIKKLNESRNILEETKHEEEKKIDDVAMEISKEKDKLSKVFDQKLKMIKMMTNSVESLQTNLNKQSEVSRQVQHLDTIKSAISKAFEEPISYTLFNVVKNEKVLPIFDEKDDLVKCGKLNVNLKSKVNVLQLTRMLYSRSIETTIWKDIFFN